MRYRKLPIETKLESLLATSGAEAMAKARGEIFLQVAQMEGFQFVTAILRDRESAIMNALRVCHDPLQAQRLLGSLNEIESIRASLSALVPAEQRLAVDWFNDAEEDYISPLEKGR